ncbi:MAG TPA: hypothetical protein VHB79_33050 [Polyangiaceae bacterium]|nr:hypothetical protein [Polyangiaceae bacterium]
MKSMRSSFALLFTSLGASLLFANCTLKSVDDGTDTTCSAGATRHCACTNGDEGAQQCNSKGSGYGECKCDGSITVGGSSSNTTNNNESGAGNETSTGGKGGTSSTTAGTSAGGAEPTSEAGAGGGGGEAPAIDPATDCDNCISMQCATQYEACATNADCPDQYAAVLDCITTARGDGLVKRDVVRGCGGSLGSNPAPSTPSDFEWAPAQMDPTTTALLNCMASGDAEDLTWANSESNFSPTVAPWPAGTCAKLSCTSEVKVVP